MHWFAYLFISILTAAIGLVSAGSIGTLCVRWYRISSFEGGSGYFVVGLALAGAVVGLIAGLVTAITTGPREGIEYLKTFGLATGILVVLAGLITGACWWWADIPPTVDGRRLQVEAELRLPVGAPDPRVTEVGGFVQLQATSGRTVRASESGRLDLDAARLEGERWVVPGSVGLFTRRGKRVLEFQLNGESVAAFLVSLPASPGREFQEWSPWLPRPHAPQPPWPEDRASYRYRVRPILPPPPGPTVEEIAAREAAEEQAAFDAIPADAPIATWLAYAGAARSEERRQAALERITGRPNWATELEADMCAEDVKTATRALRVVRLLPTHAEVLVPPVSAAGRALVRRLRGVVATTADEDPSYEWAADISQRFSAWFDAARALREAKGADYCPELAEILELGRARPESHALRMDVVRVASFYLNEWAGVAPLASDPSPR